MSNNNRSPLARSLRSKGYVPLPRLWVKQEDIPKIKEITDLHAREVNNERKRIAKIYSRHCDEN